MFAVYVTIVRYVREAYKLRLTIVQGACFT